ncbi:hypothetical protein CYMTET_46836 [Cymbomonas tetramitiformis]|uniref:Uncharacterized protein n=1 Tax=Cymbomonas tetramitiformis TaxID=36881 RepID=A0AAE0EWR8_9CHLO|nr:hypothetical protein CYMTET_46836 [Cymbomonas tetramitiformis]
MAHRLLRDPESDGWERSDFPILCESCLGPNPYVRMTKEEYGRECKICTRPFTIFRWRPGHDARYKKTEVCQTCSKMKNVCQVCLLDLQYGLPVQVRDQALGAENEDVPKSDVNREFYADQQDRLAKEGRDFQGSYGKITVKSDTIQKLQRTTPYYKRNRAHVCSFWVRGECTRGAECPYRHEMPDMGPLAEQNLKDRYYGVNDPVAAKLLSKASDMPSLAPPEDRSIMTLYIGGLDETVAEDDLKDTFYAYGEIASIRVIRDRQCAFITYATRSGAEKAAETLSNRLVVKGVRLKLMWGKPAAPKAVADAPSASAAPAAAMAPPVSVPVGMYPPQVQSQMQMRGMMPPPMNYFNLPPPGATGPPLYAQAPGGMPPPMRYPSMDPTGNGAQR